MTRKLFIVDGHALCYRAYYAFISNPLVNSRGQNTSAIFGFARMLLKLVEEHSPDYLAVAFDPPKKSFRFGLYPEYKANRQKMPDDLRSQIEEIKEMVTTLGIARLEVEGFEADDILGTASRAFAGKGTEVYLVTGDKDAYQLVTDGVKIIANKKGIGDYDLYDGDAVEKKLGVPPALVVDYMALTGDASDNVPGVKGIGEKTAQKLIAAYGGLDGVYARLDEIGGRQKELLSQGRDMAYLSRDLVTIRSDVPLPAGLDDMAFGGFPAEAARRYFEGLEMKSIADEFFPGGEGTPAAAPEEKSYEIIRDEAALAAMIAAVRKAGIVSMDTETTSISPVDASLVGMSFSLKAREGWYVPLASKGLFGESYTDPARALALLKPLLEDPAVKKVGQNIKYDLIVLRNYGIDLGGLFFDTMIASYLLNPNERRHNLDDLAARWLDYRTITFKELAGTGKNAVPIEEIPLENIAVYAIEDADVAWRLYELFAPRVEKEELGPLFRELEMPLVPVLADMEIEGVRIDPAHFAELERQNGRMLAKAEKKIHSLAGGAFNINSTRELSRVLFEELGLKTQKKTKTGFSTDISVLETLRGSHEIIDHLIAYRMLSKLRNTYIETLPRLVSPKTGRIHTSYNQTVAATGRLSSSDPNLQNIPVRDEMGKDIRRGFVPREGFVILSADYSQIELRIAAHVSGDERMIGAFREGLDIHTMTASSVFGVAGGDVTEDMRRQAKVINFATIYGVSPYGLSQQAEIGVREAAEFIRLYFETYPGMRKYIDDTVKFARENGYVKTLMGRKRDIPDIASDTAFRREGAERIAINTPIQGTAADMIKRAMIDVHAAIEKRALASRMIMQVHDELVVETAEGELDGVTVLVRDLMAGALPLDVPVIVDMKWGKSWGDA